MLFISVQDYEKIPKIIKETCVLEIFYDQVPNIQEASM